MKAKFLFIAVLFGIIMLGAGFTPNQTKNQPTLIVLDGDDYKELWQQVESLTKQGLPKSALEVVDLRRPMDDKSNYLRAYCFFRFFFCRCTQ